MSSPLYYLLRKWLSWKPVSLIQYHMITHGQYYSQITEALDDPVTHTGALLSLICALMSLIYGYIVILAHFGLDRI